MTQTTPERTAVVPITIVCPDRCSVTPEVHVAELWDNEGRCYHHGPDIPVVDTVGFPSYGDPTRFADPINLSITTTTNTQGREVESAIIYLNQQETTVTQALAYAEAIIELVATYRAEGGVE